MKQAHRVKMVCFKRLHLRVIDRFTVVVKEDKKDVAKKEYERQGYKVVVL